MNLSMLKSFLSLGAKPETFKDLLIGRETEIMGKHCGKYPVVFLNLKDCKGDTWGVLYREGVWSCIRQMVLRHKDDIPEDIAAMASEGVDYSKSEMPIKPAAVKETLYWLTQCLYKKRRVRVIVLIDEYDTPLNDAFQQGFYTEASRFFGLFYSKALKDNDALKKACLVGCVEVKGAGILSGLNNFRAYSVVDDPYSAHFGFTKEEIAQFFRGNEAKVNDIISWYNGYRIGQYQMVNPWSFACCVKEIKFQSSWVATSAETVLFSVISPNMSESFGKLISILAEMEPVSVSQLSTEVNYSNEKWDTDSMLHFLVLSGYLSYSPKVDESGIEYGEVSLPNRELKRCWKKNIFPPIRDEIVSNYAQPLYLALANDELDLETLRKLMQDMVLRCSFFDVVKERDYHNFFFGIMLAALFDGNNVHVTSNRESGHGRYDICIDFVGKRAVIIKLKSSKSQGKLSEDADKALAQNREYPHPFPYPVELIGVSFYKKFMSQLVHQTYVAPE